MHRTQEAFGCLRKRLLRQGHVPLAHFERLDDQTGRMLQVLQRHARRILAGDGHSLEMRHELVLVELNVVGRMGHIANAQRGVSVLQCPGKLEVFFLID